MYKLDTAAVRRMPGTARARGREALQLWARLELAAYSLDITNMSSDWRSGEAFCAIIHRYRTDHTLA